MDRLRQSLVASLLAGFVLAACGGTDINVSGTDAAPTTSEDTDPTPQTTEAPPETTEAPAATTTTAAPETTTTESAPSGNALLDEFETTLSTYLGLSGSDTTTDDLDIEDLFAQGQDVCASLDRDNSLADAGAQYFTGSSVEVTGALIFATIDVICPQHTDLKDELISAASSGTPQEQFIGALRSLVSSDFVDEFGEQALIDLATDTCARLDGGESLLAIYTELFDLDPNRVEELGATVGVGIGLFCPEYIGELEDLANLADELDS